MKNNFDRFFLRRAAALCLLLACLLPAGALAYDAQMAEAWLCEFAQALGALAPLNDPAETADPARAGQYLIEYEFGTVTAETAQRPSAADLSAIDIRTAQVTDCRGMRVGMSLQEALGGMHVGASSTQLYVLFAGESGWGWAYTGESGVYGVEYIAYGGSGAAMKEYTLTYVIDDGVISAIRLRIAEATQAQAQDALRTAQEIASRQHGETWAMKNDAPVFSAEDLQVMGASALGADVASLVVRLGEPENVQTLPEGAGRILLYDGAAVTLAFDEYTGVEIVRSVSVSSPVIEGPRRLLVGMSVQEAASLFACEQDVSSLGGTLYLAGEAQGEPPYGEMIVPVQGEAVLRYVCLTQSGEEAVMEAGIQDGALDYWKLYYSEDTEGGV